jgi:hypothetical protein
VWIWAVAAMADASRALGNLYWVSAALKVGAPLDRQLVERLVGPETVSAPCQEWARRRRGHWR